MDDDGVTASLRVGETATLRLRDGGPEPVVTGEAILLIRVDNVAATGYRQWEIRAVRPGTSRLTVPRTDRPRASVTFVVR
jgi:predicted secreted protein